MKKIIILIILLSNISCSPTNKEDALKEKVSDLIIAMRNNDLDRIYENLANEKDLEKVYINYIKEPNYSFEKFKTEIGHLKMNRISYFQEIKRNFEESDELWETITPFAILYENPKGHEPKYVRKGWIYFKTESNNIYDMQFTYRFINNNPIIIDIDDLDYEGNVDEFNEKIKEYISDSIFYKYILF